MFILCVKTSHAMGMGHLFRMINLYEVLHQSGANACIVLLGEHPPAREWLEKKNIPFAAVANRRIAQPDWEADLVWCYKAKVWVNDCLKTDAAHATRIKELGLQLVTFDDLGKGAALADIHVSALAEVRGEKPQGVKVLTGLQYLILPHEIAGYRRQRTQNKTWIVSLGGSDTHGVTVKVAQWLSAGKRSATLILGPGFEHEAALARVMNGGLRVKKSVPSLAAEFAACDLAITGGGLTAFEAGAAGLPTVTVANEQWETAHCLHLQALGCSVFAGPQEQMDLSMLETPLPIETMSRAALAAIDLDGANRVCQKIMPLIEMS